MKKLSLSLVLLGMLGWSACKKDDKNSTKAGQLMGGKWQLTASLYQQTVDGVAGEETNSFDEIKDCEKDDFILFMSNKLIMSDEGPTKCDPSDIQQVSPGTWALEDNDTKMIQSIFGDNTEWAIEQLDNSNLRISTVIVDGTVSHKSTSVYRNIK